MFDRNLPPPKLNIDADILIKWGLASRNLAELNKKIWERLQKILKESPSEEKKTIKKIKKMKRILTTALLLFTFTTFSQVKVIKKEKSYLYLLTDKYEIITSHDGVTPYYEKVFRTGYKYPAIQEGFYVINIFTDISGLVKHYTELANLENLEDGEYDLSAHVDYGIHAIKKGSRIKLKDESNIYNYGKYKIDDIKTDLTLLKSMVNQ